MEPNENNTRTVRPIQAGDLVVAVTGWPARLHVYDVNRATGTAEVVAANGVRLRVRLGDLVRVAP
jgi:uncharacterized cupin superfamily protein